LLGLRVAIPELYDERGLISALNPTYSTMRIFAGDGPTAVLEPDNAVWDAMDELLIANPDLAYIDNILVLGPRPVGQVGTALLQLAWIIDLATTHILDGHPEDRAIRAALLLYTSDCDRCALRA